VVEHLLAAGWRGRNEETLDLSQRKGGLLSSSFRMKKRRGMKIIKRGSGGVGRVWEATRTGQVATPVKGGRVMHSSTRGGKLE